MSSPMDRERWQHVRGLVEAALDVPAPAREQWLAQHCGGDPALRAEVERLLHAHALGESLESNPDFSAAFSDETPHMLRPGDRIGIYVIEEELARGGMGVVYRAWDTRLERTVALKALSPTLPADVDARERLRREARAAGRLSHESIATIYALEEIDDELFIASEYVAGETLRARLAAGRLKLRDAVKFALAAARGLSAAHELGVVHRDLKPENVMVASDGRVKVVDFGIASLEGGRGLTRTGIVLGTPGYMAPEQVSGQGADARSDVFALGVLLYEMVSGRPPFGDSASWSVIAAVLEQEPEPLSAVVAGVPPALERVVTTCLAKSPAARYPTAGAVAAALELVLGELAPATGPAPRHVTTPVLGATGNGPVWWLQVHQLAATASVALMMIPGWKLMSRLPGLPGRALVLSLLAIAATLGTVRLHLWFTARHEAPDLVSEIPRVAPMIRWANRAFAALLGLGGLSVAEGSLELAAVCLACAAGTLAVGEIVEPATLSRALGPRRDSGRGAAGS